jgi:hypothetical protein
MQEQVLENIINLLQKLNYFDVINKQIEFEKFIQGLNVEQFKNLLITFNAKLRNTPVSEKGFQKDGFMVVGDWVSPSKDVQNKMLEKLLGGLKQLKDNKDRATLTYYMLLDLHMFDDGNGRTARLFYDLISGNIDLKKNINWYIHDDMDISLYKGSFEEARGIEDINQINYFIGLPMLPYLNNNGISIDERIRGRTITTHGKGFVQAYSGVPMSDEIKAKLTEEEIQYINNSLFDRSGKYTVGGLTMMLIAIKKGQLDQWIERSNEHIRAYIELYPNSRDIELVKSRFVFSIIKDKDLFDSWTLEDYKEAISIAGGIKERQLSYMIDMFLNPELYVFSDGTTYKQNIYVDGIKDITM